MGKIEDEIMEYCDYLLFEKGLSENSKEAYKRDLTLFFYFLKNRERERVKSEDIVKYIEYLSENEYSRFSIARKVTSIRNYYNYLIKSKIIDKNPCETIEKIRKGKYLPEVLTIEEIRKIIDSFDNSAKGRRDRLITELLIASGARISEIIELKSNDLDMENYEFIRVKGKGSKIRVIPVYKEIAMELRFYMENVRKELSGKEDEKEYRIFNNVDRTSFWRRLRKNAKNAGVEKGVYPHMFRHSVATEMLKNGAGLRAVQEMLGHSSITTTEVYTHLGKRDLKKEYLKIGIGDE